MSWEPVGDGRKHAPWDHTAAAYRAYWQTIIDRSRRRLAAPAPGADELPQQEPLPAAPPTFGDAPNCYLFALHCDARKTSAAVQALYCFLYAAPFAAVARDDVLFDAARVQITVPQSGNRDPQRWCPVAPERTGSRLYTALVLRLAFMATALERTEQLLEQTQMRRSARRTIERARRELLLWRDAHTMLAVALDQLGTVPRDDDGPVWRVLLERYAPDINMFFHDGELPALYPQLVSTPFFSATLGARAAAADPIVNKFRKVLPKPCATRDSSARESDHATRSPAYFGFTKLLIAASLLGVYNRSRLPVGWRMRRAVYELFFFELDPRLERHCVAPPAERLRREYAVDRSAFDLSARPRNARVVLPSYTDAVQAYWSSSGGSGATSRGKTTEARKTAKRGTRRSRSAAVDAALDARTTLAVHTVVHDSGTSSSLLKALSCGNALARLQLAQARGLDYYEQARAAGALPSPHVGSTTPPPPPPAPDAAISNAYVTSNVLPCDERPPTRLEADSLVFAWMHARIEWRTERGKLSHQHIFQDVVTMSTRALMIEQLRRAPELRNELVARTDWAAWESKVHEMLDCMRASLSRVADTDSDARVGAFLSHHPSFAFMHASKRTPINALYQVRRMPFMECLQLEIEKLLKAGVLDRPCDLVAPIEYETMMRLCLYGYRYPRCYASLATRTAAAADDTSATTLAGDSSESSASARGAGGQPPYRERIATPLPAFTIAPTTDVPHGGAAFDECREKFASRALFPLRAFRATPLTINALNAARQKYARTLSAKHVADFVAALAARSLFQLQIVLAFARSVNAYLNVYTFPLPRYLEQQHEALLARQHRYGGDSSALPPHIARSLVCLRCRRVAAFVYTERAKNLDSALGANATFIAESTLEDDVCDRVRCRGALLAPDQLHGARSLFSAIQRRVLRTTALCEQRNADDAVATAVDAERSADTDAKLLAAPPLGEERAVRVAALVADALRDAPAAPAPPAGAEVCAGPLRMIGAGSATSLRDMCRFERDLWQAYDARAPLTRLVFGHSMTVRADTPPDMMHVVCTDNATQLKNEAKKRGKLPERRAEIMLESDTSERAKRLARLEKSRRGGALAHEQRRLCTEERMFEFDRRHALVADEPRMAARGTLDFYTHCLACGVTARRSDLRWLGAAYVCSKCYASRDDRYGPVARAGITARSAVHDARSVVERAEAADTRRALIDALLSPDRTAIDAAHVPHGVACSVPKCTAMRDPQTPVYAREVLLDTEVGAERMAFVYVCKRHANDRRWIFAPSMPLMLCASTLYVLCLQHQTRASAAQQRADYVVRYMEQLATAQSIGRNVVEGGAQRARALREERRLAQIRRELDAQEPAEQHS